MLVKGATGEQGEKQNIKASLHSDGGHQGRRNAHQAGNQSLRIVIGGLIQYKDAILPV